MMTCVGSEDSPFGLEILTQRFPGAYQFMSALEHILLLKPGMCKGNIHSHKGCPRAPGTPLDTYTHVLKRRGLSRL